MKKFIQPLARLTLMLSMLSNIDGMQTGPRFIFIANIHTLTHEQTMKAISKFGGQKIAFFRDFIGDMPQDKIISSLKKELTDFDSLTSYNWTVVASLPESADQCISESLFDLLEQDEERYPNSALYDHNVTLRLLNYLMNPHHLYLQRMHIMMRRNNSECFPRNLQDEYLALKNQSRNRSR